MIRCTTKGYMPEREIKTKALIRTCDIQIRWVEYLEIVGVERDSAQGP